MKPTKEQLADPRWWDENANGYDYVYETGPNWDGGGRCKHEVIFANEDGSISDEYGYLLGEESWVLLAKRPEPEWVPEVGECFEFSANGVSWEQREMLYADDYSILMANKKYPANRWHYKTNDPNLMYKPIKTKREELIDIIDAEFEDDMGIVCIADAILARFDLTGKDDK